MHFKRFYSLNQSVVVVTWFAHLHQVGFQPTFTKLGKLLENTLNIFSCQNNNLFHMESK
jgi:hypothetical protein